MKKIVSLAVLAALTTPAIAAPSYLSRTKDGGYNVTYDYNDKAKTGWYIGGRAELSFLNWENEYTSDYGDIVPEYSSDKYSYESVFGGSFFVGHTFNYFWRAEVEAGIIGQFDDQDEGVEFKMTVPYVLANGYYDFTNGLYVGLGAGIALPKTELDALNFVPGDRSERAVSAMGAVMLGWAYKLDYNLTLDLRYRLAVFGGTEHVRDFVYDETVFEFTNEMGLILDNSISLGVRYEF
ncbi:MAG: outer membrane beta-barrel protein [Alphaproteobacteria bacterium]|nr:outer membrane beta-barrel protein [Alphaproteobacteria bacterium]